MSTARRLRFPALMKISGIVAVWPVDGIGANAQALLSRNTSPGLTEVPDYDSRHMNIKLP